MERIEKLLESYYKNNAKKLRSVVNKIFNKKYGGTVNKDMNEFYSVANDVLTDIALKNRYDESKGEFDGFLYAALSLAIIDEFKRQNRDRRKAKIDVIDEETGELKRISVSDVYLDAPIGEDGNTTVGDTIKSDYDIYSSVSVDDNYSEKVEKYLDGLSELQRKIAKLVMDGYPVCKIKEDLNLTDKEYRDNWNAMTSYNSKRILYKENNKAEDNEMNVETLMEDVAETYKNTSYSIESISKQIQKKRIRDDHILQRHSGLWARFAKSELVSDILRGKSLTQIIISEEIKKGMRMQWLIDGKQRCTTLDDFLHNGFPVSKNVKNYNIRYQTAKVNEKGDEVLNEEGFTEMEFKEFDIRGKKFSQLPEELQDIFKDRQIPVLYNMNCTKKDIADDIARFNRSMPMNKAQNGWLGLDESFAEFADNISKMPFFQPSFVGSSYSSNNETSGMIRRIIVEGIIVSDFINEFGDFDKMCEFLSNEASDSNFTEFYALIERLTAVCDEKIASVFNAKDSFLWFGLFSKFASTGEADEKFVEFITAFNRDLKNKRINGCSFEDLCVNAETGKARSTKDKYIVVPKMELLEKLMYEFLHIDSLDNNDGMTEMKSDEDFISEVVDIEKEEMDMELYEQSVDDLTSNTIRDGSKLLEQGNRRSLLAMIAYSYKADVDLDEWMAVYAKNNNTYFTDQRKNYLHMKEDLEIYLRNKKEEVA